MTSALVSSPTYGPACLVREVVGRAEWERLYRQLPMPHMVQAWVYGEAKAAEGWGVERLVFEQGGRPLAICQVQVRRILGLTVAAIAPYQLGWPWWAGVAVAGAANGKQGLA